MAETALATAYVNVVPSMKGFSGNLRGQLNGVVPGIGNEAGATLGSSMKGGFLKNFVIGGAVAGIFASVTASVMSSMGQLAREAIKASDATDKFKQTLNFAGIDSSTIDALTKSTRAYADRTVYDLATIQNATAQLAANGVKDYDKLVEASGNLNAVAGGNADTFRSVSMVLTQTAGAGKLTTENWNQLANAIPGASGMLMDSLKKAGAFTGNFRDAMAKGMITADEFNAALMQLGSDPIAVEAAKSTATFEGALGNLKATIVSTIMDPLNAAKPQITGAITWLSNAISTVFSKDFDFSATLQNLTKTITDWLSGGGLSQMITGFTEVRTRIVTALAESLPAAVSSIVATLGQMLPAVVETLLGMIPQLLATAQTLYESLYKAIDTVVPKLLQTLVTMLPKIVSTLQSMLPGIIQGAINLFLGLVTSLTTVVPKLLVSLLDALPKIVGSLLSMLPTLISGAVQLFTGLINGLLKVLPNLIGTIMTVVLPKLLSTIGSLIPVLLRGAVQLFLALVQAIPKILPALIRTVYTLVPLIVRTLIQAIPLLIQAGYELVRGLVKGIIDNGPALITGAIKGMADLAINTFKALLGIHSPSKVFREFGKNIMDGLVEGLTGSESSVRNTMKRVAEWVDDARFNKQLSKSGAKAANALIEGYTSKLAGLAKQHEAVVKQLESAQDELAKRLQQKADFVSSIAEKYGTANAIIDGKSTLKTVVADLQARIAKSKELKTVTDQLLKMGLNEDLYKQIVEAGAVDFAKSIIEGGSEAVKQLNVLAASTSKEAQKLAERVGGVLYDQGITFAESVVDGLLSQEENIADMLSRLADEFASKISAAIKGGIAEQEAANKLADAQAKKKEAEAALKKAKPGSAAAKKAAADLKAANKAIAAAQKAAQSAPAASTPDFTASWVASANAAGYTVSAMGRLVALASGGFVNGPTPALVGEAGPEVVTPLKDFERMMGLDQSNGNTVIYNAAPNQSLDSEQALFQAIRRAKVVGAW